MAKSKNNIKAVLKDTADAIRAKKDSEELIEPRDFADEIASIIKPEGTLEITENGEYDVFNKANVDVNVPQGVFPAGTKEIRNNGEFDITNFEKVNVDVPGATTKELFEATENGTYDIAEYANVKVDVPNPSTGVLNIDANGEYDVTEKAGVNVAVPQPSGKAPAIVANGTNIDIKDYETVDVNVPNPSTGTLEITENGEYDVTEKAAVNVNTPQPSGTLAPKASEFFTESITTFDVTDYKSMEVPSVRDLCSDTKHESGYGPYGGWGTPFNVAGYQYIDIPEPGGSHYETLYSGYYYVYNSADVKSTYDFSLTSNPNVSLNGDQGMLVLNGMYESERAWSDFDYTYIDNVNGLEAGESTEEFSLGGKTFKITRVE